MNRSIGIIIAAVFLLMTSDLHAQRRRPPVNPSGESSSAPAANYIGIAAGYNHISGIEWESVISRRKKASSKSTFSITLGHSSRLGSFEMNEETGEKKSFIHGVGGAISLNNYIHGFREGIWWSVGVAGHYYFQKFVDLGIDDNDQLTVTEHKNLKTFSVFGSVGYKWKAAGNQNFKANLMVGLMGSPFRSSSPADINGFFLGGGLGYAFRLN